MSAKEEEHEKRVAIHRNAENRMEFVPASKKPREPNNVILDDNEMVQTL